jgi:hypothetical protein
MATLQKVMDMLKSKGREKTRTTYARHGMGGERTLGVSVADLKVAAKGLKGQQSLALELYATGMMEAMYLAGMVANGAKMSKKELQSWAEGTGGFSMIFEHTVPWVTVESAYRRELALKWMGSKKEDVAAAGWRTYGGIVTTTADAELDLGEIEGLLGRVVKEIGGAQDRVKLTMNGFVISVGGYIVPLVDAAKKTAKELGEVGVDMGDTACKVPDAAAYIAKMEGMGKAGVKRKTIRC